MIRKLFLFSGGAFLLALVCLAGAAALVSNEVGTKGWNIGLIKDGDHVRIGKGEAGKPEPSTSKTIAWTGGDLLAVDLPAGEEEHVDPPLAGAVEQFAGAVGPEIVLAALQQRHVRPAVAARARQPCRGRRDRRGIADRDMPHVADQVGDDGGQ